MVEISSERVVIIGAGSIGLAFSATFADAGFSVSIVEPDPDCRHAIPQALEAQNAAIALAGLKNGASGKIDAVAQ